MKKPFVVMILILGALFALSACSNEATDSPDGTGIGRVTEVETIYIGALFPSSGVQSELIADLQAAMIVAADIINNAHDIEWDMAQNAGLANYGKAKVEIVFADCGVTVAAAREAAEKLIDKGVSIITGCYDSTLTEAVAEVCQKHGVPMISGSTKEDKLTDVERSFAPVFNRIAMSSKLETALFLNYLNQYNLTTNAGIKKAAIAYINNEYGNKAAENLEAQLVSNGLQVVAVVSYDTSSTDFTEPASKMIANAPDVIFQISSTDDLVDFAKAYHGAAFVPAAALCYSGGFQQHDFLTTALNLEDEFYSGVMVCPDTLYDDGDAEKIDAKETAADIFSYIDKLYRQRTQKGMDTSAYLEFAAIIVAAQAVETAGTTDHEALNTALKETSFLAPYLFSGSIDFDEQGQNIITPGYIATIKEGRYQWVFSPVQVEQNSLTK